MSEVMPDGTVKAPSQMLAYESLCGNPLSKAVETSAAVSGTEVAYHTLCHYLQTDYQASCELTAI